MKQLGRSDCADNRTWFAVCALRAVGYEVLVGDDCVVVKHPVLETLKKKVKGVRCDE